MRNALKMPRAKNEKILGDQIVAGLNVTKSRVVAASIRLYVLPVWFGSFSANSFDARSTLRVGDESYEIFRLDALEQVAEVSRLPFSLKILLENLLRHEDGRTVTKQDILAMAEWLKGRYPSEMTVVIQHWFENLIVTDEGFSITLNFGNNPEPLVIPFDALRTFVDPSVAFGLRFRCRPLHFFKPRP